jgi:phospholipid/cholesterol/gamma-HCH transport system substrate-binding protein
MRTRAQTARLGVFVATALGLLLGALIILSGTTLLEQRDRYTILFSETVSGLEVGAPVKLLGVRVGRIESFGVRSDGVDKVEVTVSLDHGTPIRDNARARLSGSGLTGLMFVEITGGTADADLIPPGGKIPADPSVLGSLTGRAEDIAIKTEEVLNRILRLTAEENVTNFRLALDNVQVATRSARNVLESLDGIGSRFAPLIDDMNSAATALRAAGQAVSAVATDAGRVTGNLVDITRADGSIQLAIAQLQRTLEAAESVLGGENAAQLSHDMRQAIRSFTDTMNTFSNVIGGSGSDVREVTSSLRDAAEHLEEFARAIRENPSLLIRSTREE